MILENSSGSESESSSSERSLSGIDCKRVLVTVSEVERKFSACELPDKIFSEAGASILKP